MGLTIEQFRSLDVAKITKQRNKALDRINETSPKVDQGSIMERYLANNVLQERGLPGFEGEMVRVRDDEPSSKTSLEALAQIAQQNLRGLIR